MNDEIKSFILGLSLGVILTATAILVPLDSIWHIYKIGLIPSCLLSMLALIMGGQYRSKKNKLHNEHQSKKTQNQHFQEERVWKLIIQNFAPIPTIILFSGSWISTAFLSYQLFDYIKPQRKEK